MTLAPSLQPSIIRVLNARQVKILRDLGLAIRSDGTAELQSSVTARHCKLPHSSQLIAAIGWSSAAPEFTAYRLSNYSVEDLVLTRSCMPPETMEILATLSGLPTFNPINGQTRRDYYDHLLHLLENRGLDAFFAYDRDYRTLDLNLRPHYITLNFSWETAKQELKRMREVYSDLSHAQQVLVSTMFWLRNGRAGDGDLRTTSHSWKIHQVISGLKKAELFNDWAMLIALSPGR